MKVTARYRGNEVTAVHSYDNVTGRFAWITVRKKGCLVMLFAALSAIKLEVR